MEEIQKELAEILPEVRKPAQYVNQEWNSVHKSHEDVDVKVVLAYPDLYEVGMPNLGLQILCNIVNKEQNLLAERAYAPGVDLEEKLRNHDLPLFSWESKTPIADFDIVGFSLQYEMTFTNVLNMLDLAKIPLYSEERNEVFPLIIGGGPVTYNPEPMAPFLDLFVIGEGEDVILELIGKFREWRQSGGDKKGLLEEAAAISGVYVPAFFRVEYDESGRISQMRTESNKHPQEISSRSVDDLNKADVPLKPVVPFSEVVHDRLSVEIMRGCTRGCRFCQAGMIYRPVRERTPDLLEKIIDGQLESTGYEEVSLCSLSSTDYSKISALLKRLTAKYAGQGISISFPSLRMDSFSVDLADEIGKTKKTGLTFAPEAGTQRLRDVINKDLTNEDIEQTVKDVFSSGWRKLKLYFMIGLPTETEDDLKGIVDLAQRVRDWGFSIIPREERRHFDVTFSVSCFTPKSCVPFQWTAQDELAKLEEKQEYLKRNLRMGHIKLKWHDAKTSVLEGSLARGDRRLAKVIESAWKKGCRFDAWTEFFRFELWKEAFDEHGLSLEFFANRERSYVEIFPWGHVSCGVSKDFLWNEYQRALEGRRTADCRIAECTECGVC